MRSGIDCLGEALGVDDLAEFVIVSVASAVGAEFHYNAQVAILCAQHGEAGIGEDYALELRGPGFGKRVDAEEQRVFAGSWSVVEAGEERGIVSIFVRQLVEVGVGVQANFSGVVVSWKCAVGQDESERGEEHGGQRGLLFPC